MLYKAYNQKNEGQYTNGQDYANYADDGSSTQGASVNGGSRKQPWVTGVSANMGQVGYPGNTLDLNSYGPAGDFGSLKAREGLGYAQGDWDNTTQPGLVVGGEGTYNQDGRFERSDGTDSNHPSFTDRIKGRSCQWCIRGSIETRFLTGTVEEAMGRVERNPNLTDRGRELKVRLFLPCYAYLA